MRAAFAIMVLGLLCVVPTAAAQERPSTTVDLTAAWIGFADDVLPQTSHPIATPFLVAGAGMFQTRETFFDDKVTSSEGAFTAGGGMFTRG